MKIKSSEKNKRTAKEPTAIEDDFSVSTKEELLTLSYGLKGSKKREQAEKRIKELHTRIFKYPWGNLKIPVDGYTFTYKCTLVPEKKVYFVKCLDWNCVFTQGDTINECKKNATEVTEMFLGILLSGTIDKQQQPVFKDYKSSKDKFQVYFSPEKLLTIYFCHQVKNLQKNKEKN